MSTAITYPHLSIDPDGVARIDGTRFKVQHLAAEHHFWGWSADELLRQHPHLRPEQVYAALTYFYDHRDEVLAAIEAEVQRSEELRPTKQLTREELLRRREKTSS